MLCKLYNHQQKHKITSSKNLFCLFSRIKIEINRKDQIKDRIGDRRPSEKRRDIWIKGEKIDKIGSPCESTIDKKSFPSFCSARIDKSEGDDIEKTEEKHNKKGDIMIRMLETDISIESEKIPIGGETSKKAFFIFFCTGMREGEEASDEGKSYP